MDQNVQSTTTMDQNVQSSTVNTVIHCNMKPQNPVLFGGGGGARLNCTYKLFSFQGWPMKSFPLYMYIIGTISNLSKKVCIHYSKKVCIHYRKKVCIHYRKKVCIHYSKKVCIHYRKKVCMHYVDWNFITLCAINNITLVNERFTRQTLSFWLIQFFNTYNKNMSC